MKPRVAFSGPGSNGSPCHLAAVESLLLGKLPSLIAHLAVTRFDDGTQRWPGTLILRTEGSNWKVILKEPSSSLQLSVVASSLDDVFALAELLLEGSETPWEHDPNAWVPSKKKRP